MLLCQERDEVSQETLSARFEIKLNLWANAIAKFRVRCFAAMAIYKFSEHQITSYMEKIYYLEKDTYLSTLSLRTFSPPSYPKRSEVLGLLDNNFKVKCDILRNHGFGELLVGFNYSTALDLQYSSGIEIYGPQHEVSRKQICERMDVWTYMNALKEIKNRDNVVAYSHRYGGWTYVNWNFNDDIKFLISTNFGFGWSSYFFSSVTYKGIQLCPFSHYIKYKNQTVGSTLAHTFSYKCDYEKWKQCLEDAKEIYNAVVFKKENAIFERLTSELNVLTNGLSRMAKFEGLSSLYGNGKISGYATTTDDDYIIACADKMAHAIEFIDAIEKLPEQVQPTRYISSIINSCEGFVPYLKAKISMYTADLLKIKSELEVEKGNLEKLYQQYPIVKFVLDKIQGKRFCKTYYLFSDNDFNEYCKKLIIRKLHGNRILNTVESETITRVENTYLSITEAISKLKDKSSHISSVLKSLEGSQTILFSNIEKLNS